ncbi:TerB family tellurite resistance protein [Glaciecola petra]|uniref:TerB family tellurite resistance protein n=1 Tax=Glaciecola petra TaxID=3075602 RepID=A0ABU2ZTI6_9ALTE|nr:TerB family tellurite resistance protein [Aestuariibacter sp. P117]MDT0595965.1 TerB family tellurite resistance protein [Aestuariibacter sp. P117]
MSDLESNSNSNTAAVAAKKTPTKNNGMEQRRVLGLKDAQNFNEDLIKLAVLLYQIDGKVTLSEQDYFESLVNNMDWHNGVSLEAFINDAIHQSRLAIDQYETKEFLFSLSAGLNHDPATALEMAMAITQVDGNRSEDELELLSLLSNRVLAKGLVA